jgi:hypothetical protein
VESPCNDFEEFKPAVSSFSTKSRQRQILSGSTSKKCFSVVKAISRESTRYFDPGSAENTNEEVHDYTKIVHPNFKATRAPMYTSYNIFRMKNISVAEQMLTQVMSEDGSVEKDSVVDVKRQATVRKNSPLSEKDVSQLSGSYVNNEENKPMSYYLQKN